MYIKIIPLMMLLATISCQSQPEKTRVITNFLEKIVIRTSKSAEWQTFLTVPKDSLKETTKTYRLIQSQIEFLRSELQPIKNEYEIVPYREFILRKAFEGYAIVYGNTDEVYCIIHGDDFITPIIVNEDNKISAFFTGIVKNKRRIVPYLLN